MPAPVHCESSTHQPGQEWFKLPLDCLDILGFRGFPTEGYWEVDLRFFELRASRCNGDAQSRSFKACRLSNSVEWQPGVYVALLIGRAWKGYHASILPHDFPWRNRKACTNPLHISLAYLPALDDDAFRSIEKLCSDITRFVRENGELPELVYQSGQRQWYYPGARPLLGTCSSVCSDCERFRAHSPESRPGVEFFGSWLHPRHRLSGGLRMDVCEHCRTDEEGVDWAALCFDESLSASLFDRPPESIVKRMCKRIQCIIRDRYVTRLPAGTPHYELVQNLHATVWDIWVNEEMMPRNRERLIEYFDIEQRERGRELLFL
jgi:hypothetical protein